MAQGRLLHGLLCLGAMLFVGLAAASCAPKPPDWAADELIFALPAWCGRAGPRRPWTAWAEERARAPTGNGVCGVRLPTAPADDDAGVCVELRDHHLTRAEVRAEVRDGGARTSVAPVAADQWSSVPVGGEVVLVRLEGRTLRARSPDGRATLDGPCFFR